MFFCTRKHTLRSKQFAALGSEILEFLVVQRSDDVIIVEGVAGRVAAEVDVGSVLLESIVKGVEEFGRDEVSRHEYIRARERLRRHISVSLKD